MEWSDIDPAIGVIINETKAPKDGINPLYKSCFEGSFKIALNSKQLILKNQINKKIAHKERTIINK